MKTNLHHIVFIFYLCIQNFAMNEENRQVRIDEIIPLVEKKPILWDKHSKWFKNKDVTLAAWDELCLEYNKEYANFSPEEKNDYRDIVIRKWRNARDSWRKTLIKTIRGEKVRKKYIYHKELLFLKGEMKLKEKKEKRKSRSTADSSTSDELSRHSELQIKSEELLNSDFDENDSKNNELTNDESEYHNTTDYESIEEKPAVFNDFVKKSISGNINDMPGPSDKPEIFEELPSFLLSQRNISNHAESEVSQLLNSKNQEDRHISFIKGVLPTLRTFNETQVLKFQIGVLQLIQNIQENTL